MINVSEKSKCSGCYACAEICPKKCIDMISDAEGFWYPKVNETQCIHCGACEKVCPITTSHSLAGNGCAATYAAMHKKDSVRLKSSSGGIFSALATHVLEQGGVVFGAGFDENFNVVHKYVENMDELEALRGSKYVQSRIGNAYRQAEDFLKAGRLVLFSGTPCQIGGLLSYVKKPYENLITQDLICHGVPSPMVWQKYIEYRKAEANGAKPRKIAFRAKDEGWKRFSVSFLFENDTQYRETMDKDPMIRVFLKNLCLRPSCYDCHFKAKARKSDITLADFWGVKNVLPEMDDDKGTSLVMIHSQKGGELFERISDSLQFVEADIDEAICYNSSMIKSVKKPKKRELFLKEITKENFLLCQKRYCRETVVKKIRRMVSKLVGKIKKGKKN